MQFFIDELCIVLLSTESEPTYYKDHTNKQCLKKRIERQREVDIVREDSYSLWGDVYVNRSTQGSVTFLELRSQNGVYSLIKPHCIDLYDSN